MPTRTGRRAATSSRRRAARSCTRACGPASAPSPTSPTRARASGSARSTSGHLDEGIAGFWNDMNEPGVFLSDQTPKPDTYHHPMKTFPLDARHAADGAPGTHARYHNVYGMQMARSTFEGLKKLRPDARPFVLTRAGYAGVQRYSAVWTGDNVASWDHLRLSIPMLFNLGVSGVPFVGCGRRRIFRQPQPRALRALAPGRRAHAVPALALRSRLAAARALLLRRQSSRRSTAPASSCATSCSLTSTRSSARTPDGRARHAPALVRVPARPDALTRLTTSISSAATCSSRRSCGSRRRSGASTSPRATTGLIGGRARPTRAERTPRSKRRSTVYRSSLARAPSSRRSTSSSTRAR